MAKQAKFALVKQSMGPDLKIIAVYEYEVRLDARNEADRRNRTSRKYHFSVMPLLVGKIPRKVAEP